MKKIGLGIISAALAIILSLVNFGSVSAESISDLEKEINELEDEQGNLEDEKGNLESDKEQIEEEINENKDEQSTVNNEISDIESQLSETQTDIQSKETEIDETNQEIEDIDNRIEELKDEIVILEDRIQERDELLKDRLRSIQKNGGGMHYLEVILGSQSFGDFINRSSAVNVIMDQDKSIMEAHNADKLALEENKNEVETKLVEAEETKAALESQKEELVALESQLDDQMDERETLMAELEEEHGELEEKMLTQEEEQEVIRAEEEANRKAIELAQNEKSELEQLAKEKEREKERAAQAEQEKAEEEESGSNDDSGSGNSVVASTTNSGGGNGKFSMPASGGLTDTFGMRDSHPIHGDARMHNGIDLGTPIGTTLRAAADGVVSTAGTQGGFGNVIIISHSINGQSYTTVYAHLSSMSVSSGQTVSEGQTIGATGNTGNSTGPHLHFEIHKGGYGNPVNPLPLMK
ncbi:murein DD-endopeptidase MepM/ murein hydrolase activator NlpD [Virgibacillus natechei]|uniref:Murein DD-endopeptidase MepM/ murein hydrolase activator NlpD n=1 Tax=Virgibacillus natechei TaxID=1216297 RepID=A0ABS4IEM9_9BACI|nr:M23 family metallopeptidase [Virgibacillus natechei]MBP1969387.1 murein DD-endopeptidase MepM/ murein hydrolase activator NlpD [Virgibacillus natechei]UZD11897.1 peptidoglycan DD-metalloendopeptidase family protein [Virgibacillus natechei]